jgi:tetratricopeptide (TPR) repeat protein
VTSNETTFGDDRVERIDSLLAIDRYEDAEKAIRAGLAEEPQNAELLWRLARVLLHYQDRWAEGLDAAGAAVGADPSNVDGHRLAALLLSELGRHGEAMQAGYTAVTLAPNDASCAIAYSFVLQRAGRLVEACQVARQSVTLAPHSPATHLRVADTYSSAGDVGTARRAYEQVLELDPTHAVARHDLALLDAQTHRPGRALQGLVSAGRMDPQLSQVLVTVRAVLWQLNWRLRIGLIVAVVAVIIAGAADATRPTWATRIVALLVIAGAAFYTWRSTRELPAGTNRVVMAALRGDGLLMASWVVIGICLLAYLAVAVTGIGVLAAIVWPAMILLNLLAIAARIRRRARR